MNEPAPVCICSGPGHCQRYNRLMVGRFYEICSEQCPASRPCPDEETRNQFLQGLLRQAAGGAPVEEPSLLHKAATFKNSYKRWLDAGSPLTPPEERAKRRVACNRCRFRDPKKDACLKCGCPLEAPGFLVKLLTDAPGKLLMATEGCPLTMEMDGEPPRWLPLVQVPGGCCG